MLLQPISFSIQLYKVEGTANPKDTGDARLLCRAISNEHYVKGIVLGNSEFNPPESAALTVRLTNKASYRGGTRTIAGGDGALKSKSTVA